MVKKILSLVFLVTLICTSYQTKASHYLGGELTWKCTTGGRYIFTLKLYRDCRGVGFPRVIGSSTENINFTGGASFNLTLRSITDLTPSCGNAAIAIPDCNPANNNNTKRGAVEEFIYDNATNPITLPSVPPAAGGWIFSNTNFARPPSVNLTTQPGQTIRTVMYPYIPAGSTIPLPANPCYDNSPRFLSSPNTVICSDYKFSYNHLASDTEIDSLFYTWADPLVSVNPNTSVTFATGYSRSAPYPDGGENLSNGPVTLDGVTGQLTVEAYNPPAGNYISCVKVEAWKNCQLKAEIFRDLSIVFNTDAACAGNNPPTANIDLVAWPGIKKVGDNYYASVYPGDTIRFDLLATDPDLNGFNFQQICLNAVNDEIGSPFNSQLGCVSGKTPCATLSPIAPQTTYCNSIQNEVAFLWVPSCLHLATERGCRGFTNTYPFALRMVDNGCPAPAISVTTIVIDVLQGNPDTPPISCVNVINSAKDVEISWQQPPVDSGLFFYSYFIYADDGSGNYVPIDTVDDYNVLTTTISSNQMPSGSTIPGSFYVVHSDTSRNSGDCPFFSPPSDTLSTINVQLTQPVGGRSDTLVLNWNPINFNALTTYEIWVEVPTGSGNWKLFDQSTDTTFSSFLQACDDQAIFEIRVLDPVTGCYSTSTLTTPGDFKDETNADIIVLDSVTVSQVTGLANISWQPTTQNDVDQYRILFNDPNIGWTVIDSVEVGFTMPYEWAASQASSRAEEFRVISVDTCGNQSNDKAVIAHKTIFLRDYLNKCEGYLRMSWSNYKGFAGGIGEYKLLYVETDINGVTGSQTLAFSSKTDTIHRINRLRSGSEYCFTVVAYDTAGTATSTSNEVCIDASVSKPSEELYIANVTNNIERNSIDIFTFIDGTADVSIFQIERALDRFGPWENIGTVGKPQAPPYTISFSDFGADINNSYYYRISATDSCGGRDTISNIGRNLVITATSNANLTNGLSWNPYEKWDGKVGRYDIYRSIDEGVTYGLVGTNEGNDTTFEDNISAFADERVEFCYYVRAVEKDNPLNYVNNQGQPFSSRSNSDCVYQRVKMFMPNAFRPESSVPENQTFGPSLRFDDVNRYRLLVTNRWGSKVFETDDPLERWDGKQNGKDLPAGVYLYKVRFATEGSSQQEESGSFTLIR